MTTYFFACGALTSNLDHWPEEKETIGRLRNFATKTEIKIHNKNSTQRHTIRRVARTNENINSFKNKCKIKTKSEESEKCPNGIEDNAWEIKMAFSKRFVTVSHICTFDSPNRCSQATTKFISVDFKVNFC